MNGFLLRQARVLAHLDGILDEGDFAGAAEEVCFGVLNVLSLAVLPRSPCLHTVGE
jgi:hypothetical protein